MSRAIELGDAEAAQGQLLEILIQVGEEPFFEAFDQMIQSTTGIIQSHACGYAMKNRHDSKYGERASRALKENLGRGTHEDQLHTAFVLFFNEVANDFHVPELHRIWCETSSTDNRRLWVAGAIFQGASPAGPNGELRFKMMSELRSALRSDDTYSVLMASLSFRGNRLHEGESEQALLNAAKDADADFRIVVAGQLVRACGATPNVIEYLAEIARNEEEEVAVRVSAILSLARTPREICEIDVTLTCLLVSPNWQVVANAVNAIGVRNKVLPSIVLDRLRILLGHDEVNLRGTAIRSLIDAGEAILVELLPELVQRLAVEDDEHVLEALVVAIAMTGAEAIPWLEEAIKESTLSRIVYYQYTLFAIGRKHAEQVARLMASKDARVRQATAWALQSMASDAAPAIGVLQDLLKSDDPDVLRDVLISMRQIGPSALPATQQLARLLVHADVSIRNWASDTLLTIGPCANDQLEAAIAAGSLHEQIAIDKLLQRLGRASLLEVANAANVSVDGVNDETELSRFVAIGTLLVESGAMSFLKLEKALEPRSDKLSLSASTIRRTVESLESKWSEYTDKEVILIDRSANAKGGITKIGKQYLRRTREFLTQIQDARRPKD